MNLKRFIILISIVAAAISMSACGDPTQSFNDAPKSDVVNDTSADVVTFPDGFSNVATKCDHGNRVYTAYHGTREYGAIAVVPNDPTCAG